MPVQIVCHWLCSSEQWRAYRPKLITQQQYFHSNQNKHEASNHFKQGSNFSIFSYGRWENIYVIIKKNLKPPLKMGFNGPISLKLYSVKNTCWTAPTKRATAVKSERSPWGIYNNFCTRHIDRLTFLTNRYY